MARHLLIYCVSLILTASSTVAQTTTATVQGTVRDTSHAVLPGVTVTLRNSETGFVRSTATNDRGDYFLAYVPAGVYSLHIELEGFNKETRQGLRFLVGQQATINVTLSVAALAETLTVRDEATLVETTKTVIDKVVTREQI